jgi:signal transduction histidine kinase
MQFLTDSAPQTLALRVADRAATPVRLLRRVSAAAAQKVVAAAIAPMVVVTLTLALTGDHLEKPLAAALYWSYLIAASMGIGLYWWIRRPSSRFGPLFVAFGVLAWLMSWQGANAPVAFDLGVLAEAPFFVLTFYLFLAFPMGRLEPRAARWLMALLCAGVLAFFLPWALFSPVIAGGGPLTRCAPSCPANALQIGSAPRLVEVAGKAETYTALAIAVAVWAVYFTRLRAASRPQRRALVAVAVTSLLFLPTYFVFNFAAWILYLEPRTLDTLAWGIVGTRILLPVGFLIALLQAERFAATSSRTLLERLAARPTPEQWRDTIASVLDDPSLRLAYHDPATGQFRELDGDELTPRTAPSHAWVRIDRDAQPVAAMVMDATLNENPELVRAAASATLLAVENGALEGQLRASRARILEAGHAERRRMERDLHDSAQQRLVALRIHLALAREQLEQPEGRAMLERLGDEVEEAIDELRDVAHGLYPQILSQAGLKAALTAVSRRSAIPVTVLDGSLRRHSELQDATIYFCCLECLQNATKHAGAGASVTIRLDDDGGRMRFRSRTTGAGLIPRPSTVELV